MSNFLTILGFNSAIPTVNSATTSQLLQIGNSYFLIDCGEGTQVQLRKAKAKFSKIDHIFISHLHGDHCFGLPGLVASFRLLGREKPATNNKDIIRIILMYLTIVQIYFSNYVFQY